MKRTLFSLLIAGLLLAGCSRSPDPLGMKIEGRSLDDIQESVNSIMTMLPKDIANEFAFCFGNIKADTKRDRPRTFKDSEDLIARRFRDKTVREILIEGNELANQATAARLTNESNLLLDLLNRGDKLPEEQRKALPARIDHLQASISHLKQVLTKSDDRLAELRAGTAKP